MFFQISKFGNQESVIAISKCSVAWFQIKYSEEIMFRKWFEQKYCLQLIINNEIVAFNAIKYEREKKPCEEICWLLENI